MPNRIALIFALLLLAGASATQPATTGPSDSVAGLIAQLDDPGFAVREQAERKLSEMGPGIEPRLREALQKDISDEARARLNNVLAQLDEARAMHASITLHYANAPAIKVLRDFADQSGADLGVSDPSVTTFTSGRTCSVDLDGVGFWQALRAVSDATGLKPWLSQTGISLAPDQARGPIDIDFSSPYIRISGGLLIVPQVCQEMRTVNYATKQNIGMLTMMINVIPEPKLHVMGAAGWNWVKECVDDKGNALVPPGVSRRVMIGRMLAPPGQRQWAWPLNVNFRETPGMGTKIARLRGEVDLSVQTRRQAFEIDDVTRARGATKDDGQMTVTVNSCSKVNANYRFDLTLTSPGLSTNYQVAQEFINSVELIDDQGQVVPHQSVTQYGIRPPGNGNVSNVSIIFLPTQNAPAKLRWERTLEQKRLMVPFELNDLPLPQ